MLNIKIQILKKNNMLKFFLNNNIFFFKNFSLDFKKVPFYLFVGLIRCGLIILYKKN